MLAQPEFALSDPAAWRTIIRDNGWATLVTSQSNGSLVVSHLPVLVAEGAEDLALLGHLARADALEHELGDHEVVLIVQGPHGYLSPPWYKEIPHVPTWDFVVVHAFGRPTVLDSEDTYRLLEATVDHFEAGMAKPWQLEEVDDYAHRIAAGTTAFRLDPVRVVGKAKLHQDVDPDEALRLADFLETVGAGEPPGVPLARAIRAALTR
jgi:transcriptional regulator